ncbi:MAG: hypothetical protein HC869_20495 [Rhodospirillales bacterium]|nr:hypothetical protein [Rhodospirillales bacterium]
MLALWLLELRAEFPGAQVTAEASGGRRLVEGLMQARLDIAVMHIAPEEPTLEVNRLMDDELVLVTTDPNGGYEDRYVEIAWPMDAHAKAQREELDARVRTTIDLGFSSVNYLIISQGAGYLPRRLIDPYVQAGQLYRVAGAPTFNCPIYVVRRLGYEAPKAERALRILRDLASLAVKGELPPPFWSQMG